MKRNPKSGVTLLETLIGLLVMAMVAGLISAGFGTTTRFWDRSLQVADRVEQALARRDLRLWLEHALTSPVPGDTRPLFEGTAEQLTFLTVPPGGLFWEGNATLASVGPREATAIAVGLDADSREDRRTTLHLAADGIVLHFSYWGQRAASEYADWHDVWPREAGLPGLVRIDFVGVGRMPPPMILRPAKAWLQSEMSLSSLVPPALPSRP
jgi:type II secretory pathway pseudopilin PulG